jgi:hypothetical protein
MHIHLNLISFTQSDRNVIKRPKFWTLATLKLIHPVPRLYRAMVFKKCGDILIVPLNLQQE